LPGIHVPAGALASDLAVGAQTEPELPEGARIIQRAGWRWQAAGEEGHRHWVHGLLPEVFAAEVSGPIGFEEREACARLACTKLIRTAMEGGDRRYRDEPPFQRIQVDERARGAAARARRLGVPPPRWGAARHACGGIRPPAARVGAEDAIDAGTPELEQAGNLRRPVAFAAQRALLLERQREGIAKAKAQGKYRGRAPTAQRQAAAVRQMKAEGIGANEIARRLGIGRASVYRVLAWGGPAPG
jgi:hypothetical protein